MYRAYIRVIAGDDGKPLGSKGLEPVAANLNAHAKAQMAEDYADPWYSPFYVASHLGRPAIVMNVDEAWQVRSCYKAASRFLKATGWKYVLDLNANTSRAL